MTRARALASGLLLCGLALSFASVTTAQGRGQRVRVMSQRVLGPRDPEAILRVVNAHLPELTRCYAQARVRTSSNITLQWMVNTDGTPRDAAPTAVFPSALPPAVAPCMAQAVLRWRFEGTTPSDTRVELTLAVGAGG